MWILSSHNDVFLLYIQLLKDSDQTFHESR